MASSCRPHETSEAAAPILNSLNTALDLVPVPGLGPIPQTLSTLVDRVKVRRSQHRDSQHIY